MLKVTPIHRTLFNNRRRQQTFFAKKQEKPLTFEPNRGTVKSKIKKEREK
tara:strand:+ start:239 stop:388 length:150 start_codon:yes stop_codon:yes gene_type:complete